MKVLTVIGTRPEAIKMAPVIQELDRRSGDLLSLVCVTGQHREMLDQVLELFGIVPDYDLGIMQDDQSLVKIYSSVMEEMEYVLKEEDPNWVLVQGDTTSVIATSLVAFYSGVKIGHVEAGLRTSDKRIPFPEEINRRLTSVIADLHFAPTQGAKDKLIGEGIPGENILVTGNPVIDALQWVINQPVDPGGFRDWENGSKSRKKILVTAHRRENFGEPLKNICQALVDLAVEYGDQLSIVYPVHLNPGVMATVHQELDGVENVNLIPPVNYSQMVQLMNEADLILTDSGGIQEEAPALGKPVLVMREVTERPEAVELGAVRLVGTDRTRIVEESRRLLDDPADYSWMARVVSPYGDGRAAKRIVDAIL